ncbi:MAG: 4-hydroxy-tetrahydrodipicolinate synthase [Candidatus Bathyarchaeota archaeon]|nr:MAG: 4-hydroxy-tetrahydrodipicolinate synthase [Candidatus Bathyarchaeota archaeon]
MKRYNVEGSWPALVTPFTEEDKLNEVMLRRLVEFQIENGSDGVLLLGSTSEVTMLSAEERRRIIDLALDTARGRTPVMCGVSAPTTKATVENARYAKDAGVDCGLLVQPAYIKPSQDALYMYYKEVAESVDLPIVIYNNPERAGVNIEPETIARLAQLENIVALKEAGPNPYGVLRVVELTRGEFNVLCCDCPFYALVLPVLAAGGKGTSNVSGSLVPREFAELSKPWTSFEDTLRSRDLYFRLLSLMRMMYTETNPVPLKAALNMIGAEVGLPRKPLTELSAANKRTLELTLKRLSILDEGSYQREYFSRR